MNDACHKCMLILFVERTAAPRELSSTSRSQIESYFDLQITISL